MDERAPFSSHFQSKSLSPREVRVDSLRIHSIHFHYDETMMAIDTTDNTTTDVAIDGWSCNVPTSFVCPLTLEVMDVPVTTPSGLHFERSAILSCLLNGVPILCSLTNKPLSPSDLTVNVDLEKKIDKWRKGNGLPGSSHSTSKREATKCAMPVLQTTARRPIPRHNSRKAGQRNPMSPRRAPRR